jgi:hypothetical protein
MIKLSNLSLDFALRRRHLPGEARVGLLHDPLEVVQEVKGCVAAVHPRMAAISKADSSLICVLQLDFFERVITLLLYYNLPPNK